MRTIQLSTLGQSKAPKKSFFTSKTADLIIYTVGIAAIIFSGYILFHGLEIASEIEQQNANNVYATCMVANGELKADSEQKCGDMQSKYGYEFLCSDTQIGVNCWVEKNTQL